MTTGIVQDHNMEKQIEKQMGCMTGFLQIFDRHQLLTGKRIYATKRLPPATDSSSESEQTSPSPAVSKELGKPQKTRSVPSPDRSVKQSPAPAIETPLETPTKLPLPLPVFEFREGTRSSWKFSREAPRLSLDSRATVDAKGSLYPREIRTNAAILSVNRAESYAEGGVEENEKQRRSTSVIAKLMGLEPLAASDPEPVKKSELRRSASESRVSREIFQSRFVDGNNFQNNQSSFGSNISSNAVRNGVAREDRISNAKSVVSKEYNVRNVRSAEPAKAQNRGLGQRKSFFDSQDIFPEPKQSVSIYGEIERRLRMRGIDEPSKDLETLKQILEALQLKGLLHSGKPSNQYSNQRTFVHDRRYSGNDSPIVLMKPARSPARIRRNLNPLPETANSKRERQEIDRNARNQSRGRSPSPPTRSENSVKSPNRRKPLNIETQRKANDSTEQKRASPVHSPRVGTRRTVSDQPATNRSPRNRKPPAEMLYPAEDESSSISESSISTPSHTDTERSKDGRSLLERCDKLLLSIAEITSTELQPSPVSVLDSSVYKEESSPSPPAMKRSIDFKDLEADLDDDIWCIATDNSRDSDFVYVSEIFRASSHSPDDSDVFLVLERQQFLKGNDTSKGSKIERKLIFDTVSEILDRKRQLPPWKAVSGANSGSGKPNLEQTWSEFQRIRERDASEDLFEVICGVLRKDLAGDAVAGWGDCPVETSEAVLDIERLIFKDLIGETIRDLATIAGDWSSVLAPRRKLVF